jgi:methionyl aminopeptidase
MDKLTAMRQGGHHLRQIKHQLQKFSTIGKSFREIDTLATQLITQIGATPNFSLVPGYHWATCINRNADIVHGIPNDTVIESGDLISIDLGLLWQGWNLDTSISFIVGQTTPEKEHFLAVGKKTLAKAIKAAQIGNSVYDISYQIEKTITRAGFTPTHQLTGHFIGKKLHQSPLIPCVAVKTDRRHLLKLHDTLAIEVMYAFGSCDLIEAKDGWTLTTKDGSLTALFEDTIAITAAGPEILT